MYSFSNIYFQFNILLLYELMHLALFGSVIQYNLFIIY